MFEKFLTPEQRQIYQSLTSPYKIQTYLDRIPYSAENTNRTPLQVLQDQVAHCLDGGLFAAAALRRIGFPPRVVNLFPDPGMDDDHVIAIFQVFGCYGALAKSNTVGLRYREPVYRSLRELVMSYFEDFFSVNYLRTLRSYTRPLNLAIFDDLEWMWRPEGVAAIEQKLWALPRTALLTPEQAASLHPVDERSFQGGFLGADWDGLFKPQATQ
jgi:hypothetical protein